MKILFPTEAVWPWSEMDDDGVLEVLVTNDVLLMPRCSFCFFVRGPSSTELLQAELLDAPARFRLFWEDMSVMLLLLALHVDRSATLGLDRCQYSRR